MNGEHKPGDESATDPLPLGEIVEHVDKVMESRPDPERRREAEEKRLAVEADEIDQRKRDIIATAGPEGVPEEHQEQLAVAGDALREAERDLGEVSKEDERE